jgi:hypothetical protein
MTPHWLSFSVGFVSLSQEILWMRLYGYAAESLPQAMMAVLIAYLGGIAAGAAAGRQYCGPSINDSWRAAGRILIAAGALDLVLLALFPVAVLYSGNKTIGMVLIFAGAALKAAVFPIAHHLGVTSSSERIGHKFSKVYAFNVFGATLGPAVTGFLLLGVFGTQQNMVLFAGASMALGIACLDVPAMRTRGQKLLPLGGLIAAVAILLILPERLMRTISSPEGDPPKHIVETRQGIIASYNGGKDGDTITGGNVYDGTTNLDPLINSNRLDRILVLPTLHERPRRVLMIGLSVGTWLKLATMFPGVEIIDAVEINPGYLELISRYPAQASALKDPRVRVHIDDGRRWLRTLPADARYDLVIMNTTYHWRAFSTNLLSVEFLRELAAHMEPGAILAYNATGSPDALHTAAQVFPHARLFDTFVFCSKRNVFEVPKPDSQAAVLRQLRMDGKPYYDPEDRTSIPRLQQTRFRSLDEVAATAARPLAIISDNNLATEYRYGRGFFFEREP